MTAYLYRMPVGIAGAISRPQDLTVEPVVLKSDNAFAAYGLAGKYDADGFFVPLADGDTADKVKGIYVRPYLTVKAAGVWAGGIETPSVETPSEGSKFFGFDMDNEFISGFDVGAWGVLL